jgi:hypothetical protein
MLCSQSAPYIAAFVDKNVPIRAPIVVFDVAETATVPSAARLDPLFGSDRTTGGQSLTPIAVPNLSLDHRYSGLAHEPD